MVGPGHRGGTGFQVKAHVESMTPFACPIPAETSMRIFVKGGVKPGHWGGAKVGQWIAAYLLWDCVVERPLERSGRGPSTTRARSGVEFSVLRMEPVCGGFA